MTVRIVRIVQGIDIVDIFLNGPVPGIVHLNGPRFMIVRLKASISARLNGPNGPNGHLGQLYLPADLAVRALAFKLTDIDTDFSEIGGDTAKPIGKMVGLLGPAFRPDRRFRLAFFQF